MNRRIRLTKQGKVTLGIIGLILVIIIINGIDKARFNSYRENADLNYQLEINGKKIEPSNVTGKDFLILHNYDNKTTTVKVPEESVINFVEGYKLVNSKGEEIKELPTYLSDGKYTLTQKIGDYTYTYNLNVDNDFTVTIDDSKAYRAGYFVASFTDLNADEKVEVISSFKTSKEFMQGSSTMLIPVDYVSVAGEGTLELKSKSNDVIINVNVKPKDFKEYYYDDAAFVDNEIVYSTEFIEANNLITNEKLYETNFGLKADCPISTSFGTADYINGSTIPNVVNYGIDIACGVGTPVFASNGGEVIYTGEEVELGNLVIVNHGYGIETIYANLSDINVEVGQKVDATTQVGVSGLKGTAALLHFEMQINGVKINPYLIIDEDLNF